MGAYRPLIGVSANWAEDTSRVAQAYLDAVTLAGGTPVILPLTDCTAQIEDYAARIDGLLLTGGGDIDPAFWGERLIPQSGVPSPYRDNYDLALYRAVRRRQVPVLGICRGMQVMSVAEGGSIYQDIYAQIDRTLLAHSQDAPKSEATHEVRLSPGSRLASLFGTERLSVNTIHHQAVRDPGRGFTAVGESPDGICEAIEAEHYPLIGVQWHPEHLRFTQPAHDVLFRWLVAEARVQAEAVRVHERFVVLDSHTDTPMVWTEGMNLGERQADTRVDFAKMLDGRVSATFMVAYLPQKGMNDTERREAHDTAVNTFARLRAQIDNNPDKVGLALSPDDVTVLKDEGRAAACLGLENGYALAGDISNVEKMYRLGVRYITLCHNGDNELFDSAKGNHTYGGLSSFGRAVIREMNRLGMMVDISHASDDSMRQAIDESALPVVATHSSMRALCAHPRNLTDDLLRRLAARGGVCQICLYPYFLSEGGEATVQTVADHIDHAVRVAGVDHVGVGSDFDGGGGIAGCESTDELINITKELLCRGYTADEVARVMGGNFMRVWREVEAHARRC